MYVPTLGGGFNANYIFFEMFEIFNNFSLHKENLFVKEKKKKREREYILEHSEFYLFLAWIHEFKIIISCLNR
jgi:hypothetical protein